jgi:hypothetical protein
MGAVVIKNDVFMTVFFQIVEVAFGNGLHNLNRDFFYIFPSGIFPNCQSHLVPFPHRFNLRFAMLYDFFMADFPIFPKSFCSIFEQNEFPLLLF